MKKLNKKQLSIIRAMAGRKGGLVRSKKKTRAVRKNGKLAWKGAL
jgi:hypothetical protein